MRPSMPSVIVSRRMKIALSVVGSLIVLLVLLVQTASVYINYLWFGEVGQRGVYGTVFWTRVVLFFVFGVLMAAILGANMIVAYLLRPPFRPMSSEQQNLQHYVLLIEPRRKLLLGAVMAIAALAAGASAQGNWMQWQLWLNGGNFGIKDAQFQRDISFYAWDYPVYRTLLSFGFSAMVFSLILVVGIHYLTGAIRLQTPGPKITLSARRHLTVLVFVFMALKAVAYWLDRYGFVFSTRSKFTGASYTDVHSALPAKTILFWITIILAVGVLASIWLRSALLPGIGFVVLLILSILIGGIYPAIVQQVSVNPNASTKEVPYILRNIDATRQAYDVVTKSAANPSGTVTYKNYDVTTAPSAAALKESDPTVANIRILDPNVLSPTFAQQQAQIKNFYGFPAKLDVDRYTVDKVTNDYIVGVRELSAARLTTTQNNWINQYTNYTHGYGFVAATANENVTSSNDYADGNIPQTGTLNTAVKLKVPQEYYGELLSNYAIVGAKGAPREFDGDGTGNKITYKGTGGISLSSPITKLAFASEYKETNFLLNDTVKAAGARILINRDPRARIEKVAPFLKVDGDPYPIVDSASGHIIWMVDGYTTMSNYPYAERKSLSDLTSDSLTRANRTGAQPDSQINYIRNSVKATVDAYDGTVHLYAWDKTDPVLKAWRKVFPGLVQSSGSMPPTIRAHVRYPEDLFEVQRQLLEQYHVDKPVTFYNGSDKWSVPSDPSPDATGDQPPYYVLADSQTSATATAQFQLTSPMKVNDKSNLAAYITADSDPGVDYGTMTVLKVPTGSVVPGPAQIANTLNGTDVISAYITLQGRNGSTVVHGNLLTLPLGKSFLYVEPLYVKSQTNGYPLLRRVLVAYGSKIGFGATLSNALKDLQPGNFTGESVSSDGGASTTSGTSAPTSAPTSTPSSPGTVVPSGQATSVPAVLSQLDTAYAKLNAAYDTHDPVQIGEAQAVIQRLLARYEQLRGVSAAPSSAPKSPGTAASSSPR